MDNQKRALLPDEHSQREETLERLEHWYSCTQNPLYAWEAINYCLDADFPRLIPSWCEQYLRRAASNMFLLSRSADFTKSPPSGGELSPSDAGRMVNEALEISRKGKVSAFKCLVKDRKDCRDGLAFIDYGYEALDRRRAARNVSDDRQRRLARRGLRLLKVPRAKPPA